MRGEHRKSSPRRVSFDLMSCEENGAMQRRRSSPDAPRREDGPCAQRAQEQKVFLATARPHLQDTTKIAAMHAEKVLSIVSDAVAHIFYLPAS